VPQLVRVPESFRNWPIEVLRCNRSLWAAHRTLSYPRFVHPLSFHIPFVILNVTFTVDFVPRRFNAVQINLGRFRGALRYSQHHDTSVDSPPKCEKTCSSNEAPWCRSCEKQSRTRTGRESSSSARKRSANRPYWSHSAPTDGYSRTVTEGGLCPIGRVASTP